MTTSLNYYLAARGLLYTLKITRENLLISLLTKHSSNLQILQTFGPFFLATRTHHNHHNMRSSLLSSDSWSNYGSPPPNRHMILPQMLYFHLHQTHHHYLPSLSTSVSYTNNEVTLCTIVTNLVLYICLRSPGQSIKVRKSLNPWTVVHKYPLYVYRRKQTLMYTDFRLYSGSPNLLSPACSLLLCTSILHVHNSLRTDWTRSMMSSPPVHAKRSFQHSKMTWDLLKSHFLFHVTYHSNGV